MGTEQRRYKVFVAQPTYGGDAKVESVLAAACQTGGGHQVDYHTFGTSLLGMTFNVLWAKAVEGKLKTDRWQFWEMVHSDIVPAPGHVDKGIEIMDRLGLEVLGVTSPIKDVNGLTSIAVGDPRDDWSVRRITQTEIEALPDTFSSEDVGGPLLINTGLLFVRLGTWCKGHCFTINDRIDWDEDNTPRVRVQPEDWNFSRFLINNCIPYACTKTIDLDHLGGFRYKNRGAWGAMKQDAYADPKIITKLGDLVEPHRGSPV